MNLSIARLKKNSCLVAVMLTCSLVSCKKQAVDTSARPLPLPVAASKGKVLDSLRKALEAQGYLIVAQEVDADSARVRFRVNGTEEYDEFGVYEPGVLTDQKTYPDIFVGNVYNGVKFAEDGRFASGMPVDANSRSAVQEIRIIAADGTELDHGEAMPLRNSTVKEFQSKALARIGQTKIGQHVGRVIKQTGTFSTFNQVKEAVFFNPSAMYFHFEPGLGLLSYRADEERTSASAAAYGFFRQDYYVLRLDNDEADWRLFYDNPISTQVDSERRPIVIDAVTYGRYGFLTIETDEWDPAKTQDVIHNLLHGLAKLTASETAVLNRATVRYFFFGVPDDWRNAAFDRSNAERLQLFVDRANDSSYRIRPFGDAPTFYRFSTVKDNTRYQTSGFESVVEFEL